MFVDFIEQVALVMIRKKVSFYLRAVVPFKFFSQIVEKTAECIGILVGQA